MYAYYHGLYIKHQGLYMYIYHRGQYTYHKCQYTYHRDQYTGSEPDDEYNDHVICLQTLVISIITNNLGYGYTDLYDG